MLSSLSENEYLLFSGKKLKIMLFIYFSLRKKSMYILVLFLLFFLFHKKVNK